MPEIIKIALTGGPCGGKTDILNKLSDGFRNNPEVGIVSVSETATDISLAGLTKENGLSLFDFQSAILKCQIEKENIYEQTALKLPYKKVIMICDRGTMDVKSFVPPDDFNLILKNLSLDEDSLKNRYDAVIHITTAAKADSEKYNTLMKNNPVRNETVDEAIGQDNRLMEVWSGHPNYFICDDNDYNNKIEEVLTAIQSVMN